MAATANERSTAAQIAALTRWGKTGDRSAATNAARQGLRAKFEREVDPDGTLPDDERERRVSSLLRAHMLRMSLKASRARREAREARQRANLAEAELKALEQ